VNNRESEQGSPPAASDLMVAEDAGWDEFHALMDSLTLEETEQPGYFPEGWSAKDVLGHVGSWLAEGGVVLQRIRVGTYKPEEIDIDSMNRTFLEIMRDVPLQTLLEWGELQELTPEAAFWIRKAGAEHYAEHLPRLREWVSELRSID
jgi:hypothetical protein